MGPSIYFESSQGYIALRYYSMPSHSSNVFVERVVVGIQKYAKIYCAKLRGSLTVNPIVRGVRTSPRSFWKCLWSLWHTSSHHVNKKSCLSRWFRIASESNACFYCLEKLWNCWAPCNAIGPPYCTQDFEEVLPVRGSLTYTFMVSYGSI